MAREQVQEQQGAAEEGQAQNGANGRKTAIRAAAIAAASGATAIAAKKAFSGRQSSRSGEGGRSSDDESLFATMLTSGWDSARDSLLPFAEEAATGAGEFVAHHAPEVVRDTLVPKFIAGFERAKKKASEDEE
jgi:hypothetical protein